VTTKSIKEIAREVFGLFKRRTDGSNSDTDEFSARTVRQLYYQNKIPLEDVFEGFQLLQLRNLIMPTDTIGNFQLTSLGKSTNTDDLFENDVENLAKGIVERQILSRFDTVVFLAYPIILLVMTYLANAILHYQSLPDIPFVGSSITTILWVAIAGMFSLLVVPFYRFLRAYLRDDLRGRISSCLDLVSYGAIVLIFSIELEIPILISPMLTGKYSYWLISDLPGLLAVFVAFAGVNLWHGVTASLAGAMAGWLNNNVPRKWEAAKLSLENIPVVRANSFLWGKATWVIVCCLYAIIIGLTILADGFRGASVVHLSVLIILVLATIIILKRASIHRAIQTMRSKVDYKTDRKR
jgi:hypothetical protein